MKKQTPLQELIEWINFIEHKYGGDGVSHIKTKATELLEAEKHGIKGAFNQGYRDADIDDGNREEDISEFSDAEQYFTDTYETK